MSKWEYNVAHISPWYDNDDIESVLNSQGEKGWELVTMNFENKFCVLKRPVKDKAYGPYPCEMTEFIQGVAKYLKEKDEKNIHKCDEKVEVVADPENPGVDMPNKVS